MLDLTEILLHFTIPTQSIVILWMYNMVESMCKAHSTNGGFLRNEKYIERLLLDFNKSQKKPPEPDNIFFNVYQKWLPEPAATTESVSLVKKTRKPRTKKIKTVVTEKKSTTKIDSPSTSPGIGNQQPDSTQSGQFHERLSSGTTSNPANLRYILPCGNQHASVLYNGDPRDVGYPLNDSRWSQPNQQPPGFQQADGSSYVYPVSPPFSPRSGTPGGLPQQNEMFNVPPQQHPIGRRAPFYKPGQDSAPRGRMQPYGQPPFPY